MIQNLIWETGCNLVALPLAAGIFYKQGLLLSPAIGAILITVSTAVVTINAGMLNVKDGWISIEGELEWNHQKDAAQKSIKTLIGVKGLNNNITINADARDQIERIDIKSGLERNWPINDGDIEVIVSVNNVTLRGTMESLYHKDEAGRIAWNAPGVRTVYSVLTVEYED